MPLREIEEYHRWIEREHPSIAAQRAARHFLAEIGDEPWRSPSVPIDVLSNRPEYEVREAALDVYEEDRPARVRYRHSARPTPSTSSDTVSWTGTNPSERGLVPPPSY